MRAVKNVVDPEEYSFYEYRNIEKINKLRKIFSYVEKEERDKSG